MDRGKRTRIETTSPQETIEWGKKLGKEASPDAIFCLCGALGMGKTTLIKGIVSGFTGNDRTVVSSPTFVYLNVYSGCVYHFDLYRLKSAEAFLEAGFEEYLFAPGLKCIEWSERISSLLPQGCVEIHFEAIDREKRVITYG